MRQLCVIATISATMACSTPPPAATPQQTPRVAQDPPAQTSAATARADALIEDLRRREAEQAKRDKENPPPPAPRLEQLPRPVAPPTPQATAPVMASVPQAAPVAPSNARDEQWWKNEMRTAEVRLSDNSRRLSEARDQRAMASRQMETAVKAGAIVFAQAQEAFNRASAEVGRLEAEVRNDAAAVNRVREDARRANVPPGWLRWP